MSRDTEVASFWDHLDELRTRILRCLAVVGVVGIVAFSFKETLFDIVLAPRSSDFFTFRLMGVEPFSVGLMNTGLTEQFMIHLKVAIYAGLLVASPYVLYQIFAFVSPALLRARTSLCRANRGQCLRDVRHRNAVELLPIFPLTVKFLGTYQVSADVANMLTLQSYIDTLIAMSLVMGLVFELPVVCWILGRMGLLNRQLMRDYRRHAVVVILIVAAIITPTTDAFTLIIVSLPIWLLYEISVFTIKN